MPAKACKRLVPETVRHSAHVSKVARDGRRAPVCRDLAGAMHEAGTASAAGLPSLSAGIA